MQPIQVEQLGSFCGSVSRCDSAQRLIFNNSASVACLFDSHRVQCYRESDGWSKIFSWSVTGDFPAAVEQQHKEAATKGEGSVDSWLIESVKFGPISSLSQSTHRTASQESLLVILTNRAQNCTYLCYFPSVDNKTYHTGICLHGLASASEWIPWRAMEDHIPASPTPSEASTMLLDATDMHTTCDITKKVKHIPTGSSSGCCSLLAIGFRQGIVGIVTPFALGHSDSSFTEGFHQPIWALAVEKSQFLRLVSRGQSDENEATMPEETALVYLDASAVRWNEFQYKSVNGRVLTNLPAHTVYVSTLHFIPNTQTLVVGYSFGGWQLWSMRTLTLEFSLRHTAICAPVVQVAFQEPSDDPRYCCYIWIGWQCVDLEDGEQINSQVKLYQLHYKQRYEESGPISGEVTYNYQNLVGLSERLCSELFSERFERKRLTKQLLRIQPIRTAASSSVAAANQSDAAHLVALMWLVCPGVVRVGLFDLDRWYHAQMPTQIRSDNSFFAIFDHGHLLEQSMESFWSRIAARERQLDALGESQTVLDPTGSSCRPIHSASVTVARRQAPRPVPEVCLRPSAISFSVLMAWFTPETGSYSGGFLRAQFASRQEACLMSLHSTGSSNEKHFSPTDWLAEAWASGLLESPGLDIIEEEDLDRLLQLAHELSDDHSSARSSDAELIGFRLTYGEGFDVNLVQNLNEASDELTDSFGPPGKRPRVTGATTSLATREESPMGQKTVLSPSWVLLINCLLEHGHLAPLKSIEKLANGHGPTSPENTRFLKYWFWLRFQRLKTMFDQLTEPLFSPNPDGVDSTGSRSLLNLVKDSLGLGATAYQIQQLAVIGRYWFEKSASGRSLDRTNISQHDMLIVVAVETYAQYTRLVLFLCRLGLLPQECVSSTDSPSFQDDDDIVDQSITRDTLLMPYSSSHLVRVIGDLRERAGLNGAIAAPLSEALLHACLGWSSVQADVDSEPLRVWREQELVESRTGSRAPCYPPRRLQSLCALWQLGVQESSWVRLRLALLGFILCDATAASAASSRLVLDSAEATNPNMIAVQLEAQSTQLKAYVVGTQSNPWSNLRLVSLFPNQFTVLQDYLCQSKQSDLYIKFAPIPRDPQSNRHPLRDERQQELNDLRPVGAPFLKLTQFRRAAQKFYTLKESLATDETVLEKTENSLRELFIQFSESCRRVGRLGDLINLGLTVWEAQSLVDHYLATGQYDVLFYCLVARKQYKSALRIYNQFLRIRNTSTTLRSQAGRSGARGDATLSLVSKLLANSIPEFHEDPKDHLSEPSDRQPLVDALAHPFVTLETASEMDHQSPEVLAYRRCSTVTCPLTAIKRKPSMIRRTGRTQDSAFATDDTISHDGETEDELRSFNSSPVRRANRLSELNQSLHLLDTAKKRSSEFWDTFRELIYTPPTSRHRKKAESTGPVSPQRPVLSARRSYYTTHADSHTPISILKSNLRTTLSGTPSSDIAECTLNETLTCDDDVKLNLSTVRPSLLPASILDATPIIPGNEFTFSAPRRVSARPKLDEMRPSTLNDRPSFEFATPLNPHVELTQLSGLSAETSEPNLDDNTKTPESHLKEVTNTAYLP
ncbi:unnamed protein product [Echinostoma caproni]|uniref:ELYS-bb domain-containing protein n=1 Tax=Echinostoma caproni TaxID=27848 RepID=A0A183AFA2_9TREM|nr:unnamed protein product [Echinostoma caproni]